MAQQRSHKTISLNTQNTVWSNRAHRILSTQSMQGFVYIQLQGLMYTHLLAYTIRVSQCSPANYPYHLAILFLIQWGKCALRPFLTYLMGLSSQQFKAHSPSSYTAHAPQRLYCYRRWSMCPVLQSLRGLAVIFLTMAYS